MDVLKEKLFFTMLSVANNKTYLSLYCAHRHKNKQV